MNVMRSIRVNPVLNGFVVEVGCQTLVFNRIEDVAENLVAYQKDPDGVEKKFAAAAVNKTLYNNAPMGLIRTRTERDYPQDACAQEVRCETLA